MMKNPLIISLVIISSLLLIMNVICAVFLFKFIRENNKLIKSNNWFQEDLKKLQQPVSFDEMIAMLLWQIRKDHPEIVKYVYDEKMNPKQEFIEYIRQLIIEYPQYINCVGVLPPALASNVFNARIELDRSPSAESKSQSSGFDSDFSDY